MAYAGEVIAVGDQAKAEQFNHLLAMNKLFQGRLTLESGVPVSTSDQSAKSTVYYTQYKGDKIHLFDGSDWEAITFSEPSLDISGLSVGMHDIWMYNNAGTPTLEALAWSSVSARATALARQNGVLSKTGALTRQYVGSIYVDTAGQTNDTELKRHVFNQYNQVRRMLVDVDATYHTYSTTTARLWNNSAANNQLSVCIGTEQILRFTTHAIMRSTSAGTGYAQTHPRMDGNALNVGVSYNITYTGWYNNFGTDDLVACYGRHYFNLYELASAGAFDRMMIQAEAWM